MDQTVPRSLFPRRARLRRVAPRLLSTRYSSEPRSPYVARWRLGLIAACCLSVGLALWQADPSPYLLADPGLARLLRGMALIKGMIAIAAASAVYWRLALPASGTVAALYVISSSVLMGSSMLIWQLSHIGPAALLFHGAALSMLVVAWRER